MSTEYIHFTTEQREAARQTDLVALLQSQGEQLKRSGKEYVWRDGSEKVTVRGNLWFHQYERIGGDAVDFVRRFYNMDFPQAVNFLLGNNGGALPQAEPVKREPWRYISISPTGQMRIIVETAFLADCLNTFALLKQLFVSLDVNNIKDESFFAGKFSESARRELSKFFELG